MGPGAGVDPDRHFRRREPSPHFVDLPVRKKKNWEIKLDTVSRMTLSSGKFDGLVVPPLDRTSHFTIKKCRSVFVHGILNNISRAEGT